MDLETELKPTPTNLRWWIGLIFARLDRLVFHRNRQPEVILSRHESRLLVDQLARRDFGISGSEFMRKARRGEMPDTSKTHVILMLAGESDR
jgi:hypothetical protein